MRKYRNHYFFLLLLFFHFSFFWGGGGGGESFVNCRCCQKIAVNRRTKFRNTHWSDKIPTIVEDKPWNDFVKLA